MTDAEYEEQKARVEALCEQWLKPLGLGYWDIAFIYYRDSGEYAKDNHGGDANGGSVMSCSARWQYSHASVFVNVPEVARQDDDKLEQMVVHEFMHCLVNEMRPLLETDAHKLLDQEQMQHEEHLCTSLAKAFIWMRDITKAGGA